MYNFRTMYIFNLTYVYAINLANFINQIITRIYTYCIQIKRLITDQFCITEDCLNKLHEHLTKITFVKTICLSIFLAYFKHCGPADNQFKSSAM